MADIYVRSTDGNDADNGSTWALAKATIAGAIAIAAAGDTIYISQAHAETNSGAVLNWIFPNSPTNPVRLLCVNDGAEPPTTLATTGSATITSAHNWNVSGSVYIYGLSLVNSGANTLSLGATTFQRLTLEKCSIQSTTTTGTLSIGNTSVQGIYTRLIDCWFSYSNTTSPIFLRHGPIVIEGGGVTSIASPSVFNPTGVGYGFLSGFDFSAMPAATHIFSVSGGNYKFRNAKMPASWTGDACATAILATNRVELINADNTGTNYLFRINDYAGTIRPETTIVRTGGASDGATSLSWNMTTNANSSRYGATLMSGEIVINNETTGSARTLTVEVITDGVTLTDAEAWVEVQHLGNAGSPMSAFADDHNTLLGTPASQTTSTEPWTTTGLTTPIKQKLSATFTPQLEGYVHAVVHLAKPSTTMYVCPKVKIT